MSHDVYEKWKIAELKTTDEAYRRYRENGMRYSAFGLRNRLKVRFLPIAIRGAAALIILGLGTGIWLKRDAIFGPSDQQIAESYRQTIKVLDLYSQSLNKNFDRIKKIKINLNDENSDDLQTKQDHPGSEQ